MSQGAGKNHAKAAAARANRVYYQGGTGSVPSDFFARCAQNSGATNSCLALDNTACARPGPG
jgi:hypothetical protein